MEVGFVGSEEAEAKTRAVIETLFDCEAVGFSETGKRGAFGSVLADEAVGIFVGAAFPGMVRVGKVEGGTEALFDGFISVELDTVVGGDGVDFEGTKQLDGALLGEFGGGLLDRADADQSGFALHHGD